jgi:membrane peptidoglycan carboxypeptidase
VSGANLPVSIWSQTMREAHRLDHPPPLPSNWRDPQPQQQPLIGEASTAPATSRNAPVTNTGLAAPKSSQQLGGSSLQAGSHGQTAPAMNSRDHNSRDLLPPANLGAASGDYKGSRGGLLDRLFGG